MKTPLKWSEYNKRDKRHQKKLVLNNIFFRFYFAFVSALRHSPGKSVKSLIRTEEKQEKKFSNFSPIRLQWQIKLDFLDTYPCQKGKNEKAFFSCDRKKRNLRQKFLLQHSAKGGTASIT